MMKTQLSPAEALAKLDMLLEKYRDEISPEYRAEIMAERDTARTELNSMVSRFRAKRAYSHAWMASLDDDSLSENKRNKLADAVINHPRGRPKGPKIPKECVDEIQRRCPPEPLRLVIGEFLDASGELDNMALTPDDRRDRRRQRIDAIARAAKKLGLGSPKASSKNSN